MTQDEVKNKIFYNEALLKIRDLNEKNAELLEALEFITENLHHWKPDTAEGVIKRQAAAAKIRAAIAKAKGQ